MTGMTTLRNAPQREHPSTIAASSMSRGMVTKNARSIQIVKGWLIATRTMMRVS